MPEIVDQAARDAAMQNAARIMAHEQVCELMRKRTDEFMTRMEASVSEMKQAQQVLASDIRNSLKEYAREAANALHEHAGEDEAIFKAVFARFWWVAGGGYGIMIPLIGFLLGKLLHWL